MIAVDTSALMAILLDEPGRLACLERLDSEDEAVISAATLSECLIVAAGRGVAAEMAALVEALGLTVVPVTEAAARQAAEAYARWGKGIHPARLNFGDCFAYALAAAHGCPLLFVGDDFARTDLPVLTPPR